MAAYTTASLAIPLLAKILPAWRSLKMIAVFPNLLVIAAHFLGWIPESLSWLLCKNKVEEAQSTIHSVAGINGIDLKVGSSDSKTSNLSLIFRQLQRNKEALYLTFLRERRRQSRLF